MKSPFDLHWRPALRLACIRSFALAGALAIAAAFLLGPAPLLGDGEIDEALVAEFDKHLDDFDEEVGRLSVHIDGIVAAHAEGEDVAESLKALIEEWERVDIHEVIEAKAIHLYPPIWQGIYAMKQASETSGPAAEMARAGERTKGALWQSLGGLRALAALPGKGAPVVQDHRTPAGERSDQSTGEVSAENHIELTGDDNMRFNRTQFVVRVGEPVTLRFENIGELPKDVMGHNVVVLKRGTAIEPFGLAAAEASENDFIPTEAEHAERIVAHTEMLGPDGVDGITFTLEKPGEYPFICSFTAHFRLMQGVIEAVVDPDTQPVEAILQQLETAVETYAKGESQRAEELVHAAYMNIFEGLEGDLIERDPELVSQLELDFNAGLPVLFQESADVAKAREKLESMREQLMRAKKLLAEAEAERSPVF